MPLIPFENVGKFGVVKAISPYDLPPEAWSDGQNVRFHDNKVKKFRGHQSVFGSPTVAPYFIMYAPNATQSLWLYGGLSKVYATDMSTHYDITRTTGGDYSATADLKWNGLWLGGIAILNNGIDTPQAWNPISTGTNLVALPNWPANVTARVMRGFKDFVMAYNINDSGGTQHPTRVKWSHPADPGSVPSSWDETDATKLAGEYELAKTPGAILDSLELFGTNYIYKEDALYIQRHIGGTYVFDFDLLHRDVGVLATNCVEKTREAHLVWTPDDILIHSGGKPVSVLTSRWRRNLFNRINNSTKNRSFAISDIKNNETWFCFPETGDNQPTIALVYNWSSGALGLRELGAEIAHADRGIVIPSASSDNWDSFADTDYWDNQADVWDAQSYDAGNTSILMGRSEATAALYQADEGNTFDGENMIAFVERTGLAIVGRDRQGNPRVAHDVVKYCNRIIPHIRGDGTIKIQVGSQEEIDQPVSWATAQDYRIGIDHEVYFDVSGVYLAVKFFSEDDNRWELDGYDANIEVIGRVL